MSIEKINISDIPNFEYEGYLWYSNQITPRILNFERVDEEDFGILPFVVEGWLYNEQKKTSIRITNIDGQYFISKIDLSDVDTNNTIDYHLKKDKFGSIRAMKIYQHYQLVPDPISHDWEVEQPSWFAFVGFKK